MSNEQQPTDAPETPSEEDLQRAIDQQAEMMMQRIFPEATPEEKVQLKAESLQLIKKGTPPSEAELQNVAQAMMGIALRLHLTPELTQYRISKWLEYVGYAVAAHSMLGALDVGDEAGEILEEGIRSPLLSIEERTLHHTAQFLQSNLQALIPRASGAHVQAIASLCMEMLTDDEGVVQALDEQLNALLISEKLVVGDEDRKALLEQINELLDSTVREQARYTVQASLEDLDAYEKTLPTPNADNKQAIRAEMRHLLGIRSQMIEEPQPEMEERFNRNTERLNQLRSAFLHSAPSAVQ